MCVLALGLAMAASAHPQVLQPFAPKLLTTLDHALGGKSSVEVLDSVSDADAFRYICGRTNSNGFVAKIDKHGRLKWTHTFAGSASQFTKSVALDAQGDVYTVTNTGGHPLLHKLSGSTGTVLWQQEFAFDGNVNELVITASGQPVSFGDVNFGGTAVAQVWDASGAPFASSYVSLGLPGTLSTGAVAPNGCVYFAGEAEVVPGGSNPVFGALSPDLSTFSVTSLSGDGAVTDLRVDLVSGAGVTNGWASDGTSLNGLVSHAVASYDSGTHTVNFAPQTVWFSGSATNGAAVVSVEAGLNGVVYALLNRGITSGTKSAEVVAFQVAVDNSFAPLWSREVPTHGSNVTGYGLVAQDNGVSAVSLDESNVPSHDGFFHPYTVATFSASGVPQQWLNLGNFSEPIPPSFDWTKFNPDTVSYVGGFFSLLAPTQNSNVGFYGADLLAGPADVYKTNKNQAVVWSTAKGGLLENDANGFGDVGAFLVPESLTHLSSVTVNPDGTFTATPEPGFAGSAYFEYDVWEGATYVATHGVTVKVKNDHVPPVAQDDTYEVNRETPTALDVLTNDSDPGGGSLSVFSKTNGAHGRVSFGPDGTLVYSPKKGYTGPDTFTYKVKNLAGDTATATVHVNVIQVT